MVRLRREMLAVRLPSEHVAAIRELAALNAVTVQGWLAQAAVDRLERERPGFRRQLVLDALTPKEVA